MPAANERLMQLMPQVLPNYEQGGHHCLVLCHKSQRKISATPSDIAPVPPTENNKPQPNTNRGR